MAPDRALRLKAASALARALGNPSERQNFKQHGYTSGRQIVLALDSDPIGEVFDRVKPHTPPVTVAIYFVETGVLGFTDLSPSAPISDYSPSRDGVGAGSTIGMLYQYVQRQSEHRFNFRLTEWQSVQVSSFGVAHPQAVG